MKSFLLAFFLLSPFAFGEEPPTDYLDTKMAALNVDGKAKLYSFTMRDVFMQRKKSQPSAFWRKADDDLWVLVSDKVDPMTDKKKEQRNMYQKIGERVFNVRVFSDGMEMGDEWIKKNVQKHFDYIENHSDDWAQPKLKARKK